MINVLLNLNKIVVLSLMIGLVGCSLSNVKSGEKEGAPKAKNDIESPSTLKVPTKLSDRLLAEAQTAFRQGKLIEPTHDNAYDRFQSVLMLEKNNEQARAGLQAILIRYSDLIRDAIANNRYRRAENLLSQMNSYYPGNGLLKELRRNLRQSKNKAAKLAVARKKVQPSFNEEIALPQSALKQRAQEVLDILSGIADRVRETHESVMIYARSDAEGRWIYQQMKKSANGYRIRGDIRISKSPRIALLPPL